ncbi:MAG: MlaD family protein [Fibromonadaceae bacterium]|jgi:hypothetical protein|nr:MlaD family protein [Fibromonadaceae bacterium]
MNIDKIIGSITISAFLLLLLFIAASMWHNEKKARNVVFVQFPEMGALQNQDLVTIRGYEIGRIASITRAGGMALVEINLHEPHIFRKDTRFRNVSPSIMGDRSIVVEPGKSGEIVQQDHIFNGEFEAGFAEVLALADVAKEKVALIMEVVRLLHTGDEENSPLHAKFESILDDCEELMDALAVTVQSVERQVMSALGKVSDYAEQAVDVSVKVHEALDNIMVQAQDGITSVEKLIQNVHASIEGLNNILVEFENNPVAIALFDDKTIIDDIDGLIATLQAFVGSIDGKGLKIFDEKGKRKSMVRLKNIHLIRETARSKARKRAAAEARERERAEKAGEQ